MAQQSVRRDRDNQAATPYLEYATPRVRHLDLDPLRELPCRPAVYGRARGRTDGSIRLRVSAFLMFSLALKGASTDVAWIGGVGALGPTRIPGYAMRTYSGRPSSSIRFRTSAAMATSIACRPSVCERSSSPMTRFQREISRSTRARQSYPDARCQPMRPRSA